MYVTIPFDYLSYALVQYNTYNTYKYYAYAYVYILRDAPQGYCTYLYIISFPLDFFLFELNLVDGNIYDMYITYIYKTQGGLDRVMYVHTNKVEFKIIPSSLAFLPEVCKPREISKLI